ncbi:MAG: N-acetylglucosamine-6-phosphate deacetylase, partial [Fidelibacterota bacterium]
PPVDILIEKGRITRMDTAMDKPVDIPTLDAAGRTLIPGLIDVHVHGAGGGDTSDGEGKSMEAMSTTLARLGITSFLATAMPRPEIANRHLEIAAGLAGHDLGGALLLGLHLEGPFISVEKRGGIQIPAILPPTPEHLDQILAVTGDKLRMMTIAPEIDGALEVIRELARRDIIPSFGHSDADFQQTQAGIEAGISHVTHLYNTMRVLHHRDPGPVPAIFEHPDVTVQIICDGIHLHRDMVRYIYRQFGEDRCVCITDGMRSIGMPEGRFIYYGQEFESIDGAARYLDGTLIGTTLDLRQMMLNFMEFTGCTLESAVKAASTNPARTLNLHDRKGSIEVGKDADLVLLDHDLSVWATLVNGRMVYQRETG